MDHRRKDFLRREMLACQREARAAAKYGTAAESAEWLALAAKRLQQLGGMAARW